MSKCCVQVGDAMMCSFSDKGNYTILVGEKKFVFEWSDRFGPALIGKRGNILAARMPDAFLTAASLWNRQGKRVADGLCVWEPLPFRKYYQLNKSNLLSESLYEKLRREKKVGELPCVMIQDTL